MKISETNGWIWIFVDEYGDICTEFFWPEEEENKIPYQMEKASWSRPNDTPTRVKFGV
jgi:hypothetical protein